MFQTKKNLKKIKFKDLLIASIFFIILGFLLIPSLSETSKNYVISSLDKVKNYIHSYTEEYSVYKSGALEFSTDRVAYSYYWPAGLDSYSCRLNDYEATISLDLYKKTTTETRYNKNVNTSTEYYVSGSSSYWTGGFESMSECLSANSNSTTRFQSTWITDNGVPDSTELDQVRITIDDANRLIDETTKTENTRYMLEQYYPKVLSNLTEAGYSI